MASQKALIDPFDYHMYIGSSFDFINITNFIKKKFSDLGLLVKLKYEPSNETELTNVHDGISKSFRSLIFVTDSYFEDPFFNEEKSRLLQKCKMFTDKSVLIILISDVGVIKDMEGAKKIFQDFEQLIVSKSDIKENTFYNDIINSLIDVNQNLNLIHLPKANMGQEAAYRYFYGFLRLVLPDLSIKSFEGFEKIGQNIIPKMLIIIPEDCFCRVTLDIKDKLETTKQFITTIANRAGTLERHYKSSIHKILDENKKEYYFVGEFAAPLLSIYENYLFGLSGITQDELYQERNVFLVTLRSILNHETNHKVEDKYKLLFWRNINLDNPKLDASLYNLILAAVKEELTSASETFKLEEDSCQNVEVPTKTHTQIIRTEWSFKKDVCKNLARYNLSQAIRGKCLAFIFAECLDEPGVRSGCQHDEKYIRKTFENLRFEVEFHYDLTSSEFENILLKYQMMDHSSYGAFVCCISSHGRHGNVIIKDGLMPILKMTDFFSESACPSLKEKPKMFFVQCCQKDDLNIKEKILDPNQTSENVDKLRMMVKSFLNLSEANSANPQLTSKITSLIQDKSSRDVTQIIRYESLIKCALTPSHPNFLMSYSCLPSKVSYRTANVGSIYFKALQNCLEKNVDINVCLVKLTNEVNSILEPQRKKGKDAIQEPFFVSAGLKKSIYFD